MKKFLLSFLCFLLAIGGYAEEVTKTYTYEFPNCQFTQNGTLDLGGVSWTFSGDGGYFGFDGTKGQQFGSSKAPCKSMTLSTSGIAGKITNIVINTSGASSVNASFTVSVGGTQYGNSTKLTADATSYTFNGDSSGEIKFTYSQTSSKALYISSISITYTTAGDGGESPEAPEPEEPETPENVEGGTVTFTASEYGYSNQASVTTVQMGDYVTVEFKKGTNSSGNSPKYYTTGTAIRCYGGNTFTIKSTAGNITKIVLTYSSGGDSNKITTNVGTFTIDTWTGSSQSVTFTISGTSGHKRIAKISVTYEGTNSGTPEVENVQAPVISCEKEEYIVGDEAVVTITTETEGATIYYSLDDSEPTTVYVDAIPLYETTTVKAIAKKEGANDSQVATKTIVFKEVVTLVNATVAEAIAAYNSGKTITAKASIVGYIVGAADNGLNKDGNFSSTTTVETNLLIADDPNETNVDNCMPVELPRGEIRNALNLAGNPGNYKKQVVLTGDVMAYFSVAGLKNTSAYEFIEDVWGSLYYPTAVEIPANVKAYIVTAANNNYVTLTQVTGALPANTGVIYNGKWTEYATAVSEEANVEGNLLWGSSSNTYVEGDAYVLAKVDGEVGLYLAAKNKDEYGNAGTTHFLNNANKAYLPASAVTSNVKALKFDFNTTAVENVKVETEGKKVIYDLSGRRVNDMTAPGLYIVNGKKVMVK